MQRFSVEAAYGQYDWVAGLITASITASLDGTDPNVDLEEQDQEEVADKSRTGRSSRKIRQRQQIVPKSTVRAESVAEVRKPDLMTSQPRASY